MLLKRGDKIYMVDGPLNDICYDKNKECFYFLKMFKVTKDSIILFLQDCIFEVNNNVINMQSKSINNNNILNLCYQLSCGLLKIMSNSYIIEHKLFGEIIINTDNIILSNLNIIINAGLIKRSYTNNKLNPSFIHICDENLKYYSECFLTNDGFITFIQTLDNYPLISNKLSKVWCIYYINDNLHLVYYNKSPKIQYNRQDFFNSDGSKFLETCKSNYLYFSFTDMKVISNLLYLQRNIKHFPNKYYEYGKVQFKELYEILSYLFNFL
jgi:hypothetical protein